ncbi:hypothetical protein GPECTOR_19g199 [Gonium pectorale]|uniref:MYND-type domain-containing protein n=1 Tax=Gonium pectorale TaxID=33097 RepID=A0A150GIV5_GONPE|nr:hypothetical protein GPECTOR_19g199 [Gonium pectorale]|eukprot:KXZ49748.1 hypothetical protein GPECTOR_19g199 [Gonium pectorale]
MACKAIVGGPGGAGHAYSAYHTDIANLAATHHPYEDATSRLKKLVAQSVEPQLSAAAAMALAVVESREPRAQQPGRCFCEDCQEMLAERAEACQVCGLARFCSARCKRASRLGPHASCYTSRICWAAPYSEDTAMYLVTLLCFGRHWLHRLQALFRLGHHLGATPEDCKEGYTLVPAEARMLLTSGLAPALGVFLEQLGPVLATRKAWPDEWLERDDPMAHWGLGATASRAVRLLVCLCSARPPGMGGLEWSEEELARHGSQIARVTAAAATGSGAAASAGGRGRGFCSAAMEGLVELCVNAAPTFPRAARGVCREALIALHSMAARAAAADMRAAAGAAVGAISADGLRELLAPPRGGAGPGDKDASRREVALQCLFKLLAEAHHTSGRPLQRALQSEWPLVLANMRVACAPALGPRGQSGGQGEGGTTPTPGPSRTSASASAPSTAAATLLLSGFASLLDSCRRQKSITPAQLSESVALLMRLAGLVPGAAAGGRSPADQPEPQAARSGAGGKGRQSAASGQQVAARALREAAVDALCRHGALLDVGSLELMLPAGLDRGPSLPSPTASASAAPPGCSRLLPRGVELLASWLAVNAGPGGAGSGGSGGGGTDAGGAGGTHLAELYNRVRQALWTSVRHLEEQLAVGPGNSASLCLRGSDEAAALLQLAATLAGRVRGAQAVVAALAVEQRTVVPAAAGGGGAASPVARKAGSKQRGGGGGGSAAGKAAGGGFAYGTERGLDRLARIATDPRVALDPDAEAEAEAGREEALSQLQVAALHAAAVLVAMGNAAAGTSLMAAPGLAALALRAGEPSAPPDGSTPPSTTSSPSPAAESLRSRAPRTWWALVALLCAVTTAVPRWRRELGASAGEASAGGPAGAAGGKGKAGDTARLLRGLRGAAVLLERVAPGRSLVDPALSTAATVAGVRAATAGLRIGC